MEETDKLKKAPESMKDVFQLVKQKNGLKTDQETWEFLGLSRSFYQYIKSGAKHPSPETAVKIAAMAGLRACAILCLLEMEKATTDEIRGYWRGILQRETSHNG